MHLAAQNNPLYLNQNPLIVNNPLSYNQMIMSRQPPPIY